MKREMARLIDHRFFRSFHRSSFSVHRFLLRPSQFRGARARVVEALLGRGADRVVADRFVDAGALAGAEGGLDAAVLATVEADDRGPPARSETGRQRAQERIEARQLAVDQDAQRLEDAGNGANSLLALGWL